MKLFSPDIPSMNRYIFTTILVLFLIKSSAQNLRISNLDISPEGKVSFTAMIESHHSSRENYELKVYSSADNYTKALGLNLNTINPGSPLDVSFDGKDKIGNFKGSIQFKFVAEATVFPVQVTVSGNKFKRGKFINIKWDDFHESGWYDVEMYRGGTLFKSLVSNHRGTSFTASLPKKMPKGEYEIRVIPTNKKELYSEDYAVVVKGGSAALVIGAGGALAAGAGVVLLGGGGGDPGGGGGTGSSLPDPPIPGN
ncbi:MAG: putative membrane protein [Cyclobacteriaceae bacterium]|jgi:uncharacterized membrane protein